MKNPVKYVAAFLALLGLGMVIAGVVALGRVGDGADSLQAFSEAQGVELSYNEDGQLVDRGTTEGADAILSLLEGDWDFPVNSGDLDPNDPLINTATEYMYQLATISQHTLHGTQTIVLDETVEYNGEVFEAGVHEFAIDGRYYNDFDRKHPLEGPARAQAYSGTFHGMIGELSVGAVTASTLEMGMALGALFGLVGLGFFATGVVVFIKED